MPDNHTHEWIPGGGYDDCFWWCSCGKEIEGDDITRRLNATERLSGAEATELRDVAFGVALLDGEASKKSLRAIKAAEAYVTALEESTTT